MLQKGQAYPIQINYLNRLGTANYDVSFIDPDGVTHTDFTGYLANEAALAASCPQQLTTVTYTVPYGGSQTITQTVLTTELTGPNGKGTAEIVVLVETPAGSSSWSSWSFVPPTYSQTSSSSYIEPSSSLIITIPSSTAAVTSSSSQKSSESSVPTPTSSSTENIVIVTTTVYNVHTVSTTSYIYTPWKGSTTTFYSTTVKTMYGTASVSYTHLDVYKRQLYYYPSAT